MTCGFNAIGHGIFMTKKVPSVVSGGYHDITGLVKDVISVPKSRNVTGNANRLNETIQSVTPPITYSLKLKRLIRVLGLQLNIFF